MEIQGSPFGDKYNLNNADERSAEESAIDEWLPITSSRNAKWWYSTVHNITVTIGAGILGLPYAMADLGWGPGITFLIICWLVTQYTLWQMIEMHEVVPGKRFDRYHELGQHAFGKKLGLWIVVPQQLVVVIGIDIVYMITGGQCLQKFHDLVCEDCREIRLTYFIMIFASANSVLSQLPTFNSIARVSLVAAVMSVSYSTIAWGAAAQKGVQPNVQYGYNSKSTADFVFNIFRALGSVVFSYGTHNIVMEIQATMPSTPQKPSKGPMWKGAFVAYVIIALCYFPVGFIGYWIYGNEVGANILVTLRTPRWLIAMANMFVVIHLIGGYQVYAMALFDLMENMLVRKFKFMVTWYMRFLSRNAYVAFTMFMAISFPFFGGILGFIGGFALAPTTCFLPCVMWLIIKKPRRFTLSWFANWFCIIFGVVLMVVGPIGGLRKIILDFKQYKFYSKH